MYCRLGEHFLSLSSFQRIKFSSQLARAALRGVFVHHTAQGNRMKIHKILLDIDKKEIIY